MHISSRSPESQYLINRCNREITYKTPFLSSLLSGHVNANVSEYIKEYFIASRDVNTGEDAKMGGAEFWARNFTFFLLILESEGA